MFEGICDALSLTTCDAATVAQTLGGFSGVLAAAFALIAIPVAWWQISSNTKLSRETVAMETYREYLKLAFENPEYSGAAMGARTIGLVDNEFDWDEASREECTALWSGIEGRLTEQSEKYLWFLSFLLSSCEKIVDHAPKSDGWTRVIEDQLRYHYSSLDALWDKLVGHYGSGSQLDKLVRGVLAEEPGKLS